MSNRASANTLTLYDVVPPRKVGQTPVTRIICGKCGGHDDIHSSRSNLDNSGYARLFTQKGWRVGRSRGQHRCPSCLHPHHKPKPQEEIMQPSARLAAMEPRPAHPGISEQPPRTMTRDDRRLVLVKLEEVYVSETVGYSAGWTDESVAKELACPRAWVATLREENFGPEIAQEDPRVAALAESVEALAGDLDSLRGLVKQNVDAIKLSLTRSEQHALNVNDMGLRLDKVRGDLRKLTGAV